MGGSLGVEKWATSPIAIFLKFDLKVALGVYFHLKKTSNVPFSVFVRNGHFCVFGPLMAPKLGSDQKNDHFSLFFG